MENLLHRWLLVYLYHLATWLRHEAERLQVIIRRALREYASRSYNPKQPLTKPVIPWQQRLADAEKTGKTIFPIKHRKEMPSWLHCHNCGAPPRCYRENRNLPQEYLYNFGYEHGHVGDEKFHKVRCLLCGFQTVPLRDKRAPHFFCPYCGHALVKTKERSTFDVAAAKPRCKAI